MGARNCDECVDRVIKKILSEKFLEGNPLAFVVSRNPINLDMSLGDTIDMMTEQVPGAKQTMMRLARINPTLILELDDMNMRGQQIWQAFNQYSMGDITTFVGLLASRNEDMIQWVNRHLPSHPMAVRRGGAPKL